METSKIRDNWIQLIKKVRTQAPSSNAFPECVQVRKQQVLSNEIDITWKRKENKIMINIFLSDNFYN